MTGDEVLDVGLATTGRSGSVTPSEREGTGLSPERASTSIGSSWFTAATFDAGVAEASLRSSVASSVGATDAVPVSLSCVPVARLPLASEACAAQRVRLRTAIREGS